jgi:hypothetical protein
MMFLEVPFSKIISRNKRIVIFQWNFYFALQLVVFLRDDRDKRDIRDRRDIWV